MLDNIKETFDRTVNNFLNEEVQTVAQTAPNSSPDEPLQQPPLCHHSKRKKQAPDTNEEKVFQ